MTLEIEMQTHTETYSKTVLSVSFIANRWYAKFGGTTIYLQLFYIPLLKWELNRVGALNIS